jgi:hypothetical protein
MTNREQMGSFEPFHANAGLDQVGDEARKRRVTETKIAVLAIVQTPPSRVLLISSAQHKYNVYDDEMLHHGETLIGRSTKMLTIDFCATEARIGFTLSIECTFIINLGDFIKTLLISKYCCYSHFSLIFAAPFHPSGTPVTRASCARLRTMDIAFSPGTQNAAISSKCSKHCAIRPEASALLCH